MVDGGLLDFDEDRALADPCICGAQARQVLGVVGLGSHGLLQVRDGLVGLAQGEVGGAEVEADVGRVGFKGRRAPEGEGQKCRVAVFDRIVRPSLLSTFSCSAPPQAGLARPGGFEPPTLGSEVRCSIR